MFSQLGKGDFKKRILPGSEKVISNSENISHSIPPPNHEYFEGNRNYVNAGLEEFEEENQKYKELTKTAGSSMSCVDSTAYEGSIADLKDLNVDQIKLFENYKYKDPSDVSNNLEIAKFRNDIVKAVNSNSTVLITGVTGCGKSTQVPQFILDDCMTRKKHCNIIVTQPRRIAAISVSKQVNKERGWKNGLLVGYQVGRKKDYDPSTTKILYCTTGILLQKIIKAKTLAEFTHIILDEVHERSLEMDFLLLIIKKLLKTRNQSTHVILMSATAETIKLGEYFQEYYGPPQNKYVCPPIIEVSKTYNHNVIKFHLEKLYSTVPSARKMNFDKPQIDDAGYDTAICLLKQFDHLEQNGSKQISSVLIFLPGIFEIEEMYQRLENLIASEHQNWILVPLHSSLTSEEQVRVFEIPPPNYRKIILSTNIAESSITVYDVSYVIDFCLMKQIRNELRSNYSMLVMTWASKSNCEQRAGRVGRVSDGRVYRLVPLDMFKEFDDTELPEMSRCSLSRVILMSKLLDMGTPKHLLANALDPPGLNNIVLTILTLKQVGALLPTTKGVISSVDGDITFLGKVMAHLPIDPPMAKLIYFGHIFNILYEALIMACGLSIKSIFCQPFGKHLEAYTQKLTWANHSCSDPIAYINPYKDWLERKPIFDRNRSLEDSWAYKNFIQITAMRELHDLIDDITYRLKHNFNITLNSGKMKWNNETEKAMACKVILAGAFYPNYFVRGISNFYMDEHQVLKMLDNYDPNTTVYFTGFPNDQPKELYKEALENMFPSKFVGKPTAHFSTSNKVYIEFSSSKSITMDNSMPKEHNLIPGNICFGVYVAIKMHRLRLDFKIPLLRPSEAKRIVELYKQKAIQNHSNEMLPIERSILDDIELSTKTMEITVTHINSVDCFWVQLVDKHHKNVLAELWSLIHGINMSNAKKNNLKIGDIYIVKYNGDSYRAKLIDLGDKGYLKFFLIDFGETINLTIKNIYEVLNENDKNKICNVPQLAFQCKIANIRPITDEKLDGNNWSVDANTLFSGYSEYTRTLIGTVHSRVNNVVSFKDLTYYQDEENSISIPKILIKNKLALQSKDSCDSKIDLNKRSKLVETSLKKSSEINLQLKSPTKAECDTIHRLKGPYSPLEMSVHGINRNSISKLIKIESQSVNSVLLDTDPNEYHERLFVAGNVCINNADKLTLWDTTVMPNIPGLPAIMCLMFAPCVEIRYNPSVTKIIGAICGLGYDPETSRPLFAENDIEIVFDTVFDFNILNDINVIRMLLNKCVNPEDEEGPGDVFQIQHKLQATLFKLLSHPLKLKAPESLPRRYMWSSVPKNILKTPFLENYPFDHPMGGSDVFKLIWGASFSPVLSNYECKELLYKLSKIKRLEKSFAYDDYSCDKVLEELSCPLCLLTFSNNTSMQMHFQNSQHIERYKYVKEELLKFYRGPFADLQNL